MVKKINSSANWILLSIVVIRLSLLLLNIIILSVFEKNLVFDHAIQPIALPNRNFDFNTIDKENTLLLVAGWGSAPYQDFYKYVLNHPDCSHSL